MCTKRMMVCWLAFKNLPKSFFDDKETQNFFAFFNSKIPVPKRNQASGMISNEFQKMQENVKNLLSQNESKFGFTVDGWSGKTRRSYYGITIHYIDVDWILRSLAIDFKPSKGKHSGADIAKTFFESAKYYNVLDKIAGITLDNVSANSTFIEELKTILENENIEFDINDQHFRCLAHVLNLGVQDILKLMQVVCENDSSEEYEEEYLNSEDAEYSDADEEISEIDQETNDLNPNSVANLVKKVRKLHCKIRNSEPLAIKLKKKCDALEIKYRKPEYDSKTRWNSTFDMLQSAEDLKDALNLLCQQNDDLRKYTITSAEWDLIEDLIHFLKDFKRVSEKISGEKYVTLPVAVIAFNCLLDKIEKKCFELDNKNQRDGTDEKLIEAFQAGKNKLIKHYHKCNWVYCVSLVLDPRVKAEGLSLTEWGREMKQETLKKFRSIYKSYYAKFDTASCEEPSRKKRKRANEEESLDFDVLFVTTDALSNSEKEIDDYLRSPRPGPDTDILLWWKKYANVYPILSRMARDILCVQATSVPVERLFKEASLVLTKQRCSLADKSLKELILTNTWMKSSLKKDICEVQL